MRSESPAALPDNYRGEVLSSDDWREVMLSVLGFAGGTNVFCRESDSAKVEEITIQTLSEVGDSPSWPLCHGHGDAARKGTRGLAQSQSQTAYAWSWIADESASCSGDCHCGTFVRSRGTHVFPGQISRNTKDFLAESSDISALTKLRARER